MTPAPAWSLMTGHPFLSLLDELARPRGWRLWLTGGTPRDLLLGLAPPDLDLSTDGDPLLLGQLLAEAGQGRYVPLKESQATCRVVWSGGQLDLVGLRAPRLEQDLRLRDFTVNALAVPLSGALAGRPRLIDPTGGRRDLRQRRLRLAGPGVLADDPLRVLRAYRFQASHGLIPDPGLREELRAAGPGLFRVARERVGQEWQKLMAGGQAAAAVLAMEEDQVLTRLLPGLAPGRGLEQNPFHHLDVLAHSLEALRCLELAGAPDSPYAGSRLLQEGAAFLDDGRRRWLLKTATLLHDLGKPVSRGIKAPGWATFHGHDLAGASLAARAVRRLGLSKADATQVSGLVASHMRPIHLLGLVMRGQLSTRAVRRLLQAHGQDLAGLFLLALADTMAGRGLERPPDAEQRLLELYDQVCDLRDRQLAQALAAPPLLDGRQLMAALGLEPGPTVGRLLAQVREAQLDGLINTYDQALELARRRYQARQH